MEFEPEVESAFRELLARIDEEFPEVGNLLFQAKEGGQTEEEAMQGLMELVMTNPEMAGLLNQRAMEILAPLREEGALVESEETEDPGLVFDPGVGLPRLNPLYEAALIERLQFDGDIPEFRTGAMPLGTEPAVPVDTEARSPVAIGQMLEKASRIVSKEVEEHRQKLTEKVEAQIVPKEGTLVPKKGTTDLADMARGTADTDAPSYRRGELPAPVKVPTPSGSEIALLDAAERRQKAWGFLSTSQGRRSAINVLWQLIAGTLRVSGYRIQDDRGYKDEEGLEIVAYVEWRMDLGERGTTQDNYSVIDVAAQGLAKGLLGKVEGQNDLGPSGLQVHAINTVDFRSVGWSARLVR